MVKSMTGYGRARCTVHNRDITVEVRSVNNRYLDTSVKLPRSFVFAEDAIRQIVQKNVSRGKVDVFVSIDSFGADATVVSVNQALAESYLAALQKISSLAPGMMQSEYSAADIARFPDVLSITKAEENLESMQADICSVVEEALTAYNAMRSAEGSKLSDDIVSRIDAIEELTSRIEARSPETVLEYREKLKVRMKEVLQSTTIDETRILMEAAIYAEKVAVDEETVRLRSHLSQLRGMMESEVPVGRKMDFLIQEINRESNTIGSKCNDLEIAGVVVELKAIIEKMREQVQNIE